MIELLGLPEAIIIPAKDTKPARVVIGIPITYPERPLDIPGEPEPPPGPISPPSVPYEPLTYAEEVEIICYPYNVAVGEAWSKCVAAARLAVDKNLEALAYAKRTVQHADVARQHLTLARLAGTIIWDRK